MINVHLNCLICSDADAKKEEEEICLRLIRLKSKEEAEN